MVSEEVRRRLAEANRGRPGAFKGRKHTEESRRLLSEAGKRRGAPKLTPESLAKIAAKKRGSHHSDATRAIISAKAKGRPSAMKGRPSPMRGQKLSEETRAKMSEAMAAVWERRLATGDWINPLKGTKASDQAKQRMRESWARRHSDAEAA